MRWGAKGYDPVTLEHGLPVAGADGARGRHLDADPGQIGFLHPDEWSAVRPDLRADLAPDRCPEG